MKYRIAKKILFGRHWAKKWFSMRPEFYNEERGVWVQPSWHDIRDPQFVKAHRRFFKYWDHFANRRK